jgi:S1-C subfamily serine protease
MVGKCPNRRGRSPDLTTERKLAEMRLQHHDGIRKVAFVLGCTGASLLALSAAGPAAFASTKPPQPLTPQQTAGRVQPATQLIETDVAGTLTYYDLTLNIDAVTSWAENSADVQSYGLVGDYADAVRALIKEISVHPNAYLQKGDAVPINDELVYQGSGWNITPNGYIITNAHVATINKDEAIQGFVQDTLQPAIDGLTKSFNSQIATLTFGGTALAVPDDQQAVVQKLVLDFISTTANVGNITTTVYVGGGPTLSLNLTKKGQVATVVDSGQVFPGEDVAILKVEANNLPTISLGDDSALQVGDSVYAVGYPGDATFDPSTVSEDVTAQSTMTTGTVSNRLQSSKANYQYIENTAASNHGSSGGPLVNSQGQAVGIVTASDNSTEGANGVNGGKLFYAVPASVIRQFLQKDNILPAASPDQATFNQALELMAQSHYRAALKDLRQDQIDGYSTPYLQQALDTANAAVAAGKDKPVPGSDSGVFLMAAIAVSAVALSAGSAIFVLRRRRRPDGAPVDPPSRVNGSQPAFSPVAVGVSPAEGGAPDPHASLSFQ